MFRDVLTPIAREEWPTLRDLFLQDWPKHQIAYNTIQNYINWVKIDPKIKQLEVLSLNGSWRDNGTYIILDRYQMLMHSMEIPSDSLKQALQLIDWNYSYNIFCVDESLRPAVEEVLKLYSIEVLWDIPTIVFELPKEECLKLSTKVPEGFVLKKLELKDAVIANALWPHSCEGSEYFLKRLAAWNPSVGLFDQSGNLVAWSFCHPTGAIGPLEVIESHKRKGYGSVILKAIAKEVALAGLNCYGTVLPKNQASVGMFTKVGFRITQAVFFSRNRARKLVEYDH